MGWTTVGADLPEFYAAFLPDFFTQTVPKETFATCHNCAMVCPPGKKERPAMKPYLPDRKCCTYSPSLPNYLVGGLLSDSDPALAEGQKRMRQTIKKGIGVNPFGVHSTKKFNMLAQLGVGFGHSKTLLCPYFNLDGGSCSIWKYRESICSTYFCKSVSAKKGHSFHAALKNYLFHVQDSLINYVMLELGFDASLIQRRAKIESAPMTLEEMDDLPPKPEHHRRLWGDYAGNEESFYKQTYQIVQGLSGEDFERITGISQKVLLKTLEDKRQVILDIPEYLIANAKYRETQDETVRVHFKAIDVAIDLPQVIFQRFDGKQPYRKVQQQMATEDDIELDDTLLMSLYHFDILEAPS